MHLDKHFRQLVVGIVFALFIFIFAKGFGMEDVEYAGSVLAVTAGDAYSELSLTVNEIQLDPGEVETVEGIATPVVVKDKTIYWESDDITVATVDRDEGAYNKAYITAVEVGKTQIKAKNAVGNVIAVCKVTVGNPSGLEKMKQVKASKVTVSSLRATKGTLKIKYKAVSYATGYQIRYKKSGGSWKDIDTKNKTYTLSKLAKGKYYIKVRAYKKYDGKKYYSKFTKTYKVKVK
ncbi:Fibronectin type III domain-containing protein [Butyrivibrio sp. ob235]|uniref:fibronectin type III domain-containing protein n=1 Tax=Butyrivibrio sp. ob235 TaxID=1761780 RepID=UPI0008B70504|nr:fibronectin type III domain-containing protein [Butyrivibrio sp. ob235]SEK26904.1 Fibronectin type III domain-containing protein [Butyrivibrio sp. ob235]